jgi:hypothetical protein
MWRGQVKYAPPMCDQMWPRVVNLLVEISHLKAQLIAKVCSPKPTLDLK